MKKALLTGAVAAVFAAPAFAAVTAQSAYLGTPDDGFSGPLAGFGAYKITLVSDGAKITAVDLSATRKLNAPLHQTWFQNKKVVSASATGFNTSSANSYDSYFIADDESVLLVGSALVEDADRNASPLSPFNPVINTGVGEVYGVGTHLSGAYGITPAGQTTNLDFLYIVVPDSFVLAGERLIGSVAVATAGDGTFEVPLEIFIPEPASLSIAGLGVLGLLARRRA